MFHDPLLRFSPLLAGLLACLAASYAPARPIQKNDRIVTAVDQAPVKSEDTTLLTLPKGTPLTAEEISGDWVQVTAEKGGKRSTGWIYAKHVELDSKSRPTWEAVSKSNDIVQYADYVKEHPDDHTVEIRKLVTKVLRDKMAEARRQGKNVIHEAQTIPADVHGGTIFVLGGGRIELGPVTWYSDPTDFLTIKVLGGFQYVKGRGIGITGDKVYCFRLQPESEPSQFVPGEVFGKWVARDGAAGRLVVDKTSITWEREGGESVVVPAGQYQLLDKGRKVTFQVEEVAFRNFLTGEAPKRRVDVELSLEGGKLKIVVSPTQTRVSPASPLVVGSPARTYVYERQ